MIDYLRGAVGRERLVLFPESRYADAGVTLHLGTAVTSFHPDAGTVRWEGGALDGCAAFVLATGGVSRRLPVPGGDGPDVIAWRTAEDADRIVAGANRGHQGHWKSDIS